MIHKLHSQIPRLNMAESAVSLVAKGVGNLLIEEVTFLSGVSDEVEDLKAELNRIRCFLKDLDSRVHNGDQRVRNWVTEIRDLAFKAENILEIYVVHVASKREGGTKNMLRRSLSIFSEAVTRHKVVKEIKTIKTKITSLTRSLQTYGINAKMEGESSESAQRWLRQSYPHVAEEYFVGMEEDICKLISYLMDEGAQYKVVALWGMGGLGKTSLAKKIFNHIDIRQHFKGFAWVCITQHCRVKEVLQDILRELLPGNRREEIVNMGDRELVQQIYKVQQEKKCIVVLDDIWTMEAWKCLIPAFPILGAGRSKLLLTTRSKRVAEEGYLHEVRFLNEEEGWELLQKKAFPVTDHASDFKVHSEMEKLGREMVKKCGGLPLAISVLGGILKDKPTSRGWEMVDKDISSYLRRGLSIDKDQGAVQEVLALSYNDLPHRLKQCFLYFGHFLEDVDIRVEHLCLLWIAEGMVSSEDQGDGETLMEVAERYLGELAQRSMVQVTVIGGFVLWSTTKKLGSCRLHDLIRDLCLSKGKEEDFLKVIDSRSDVSNENYNTKACRFAVYVDNNSSDSNNSSVVIRPEVGSRVKSLFFHSTIGAWESLKWPVELSKLTRFAFLRVLELRQINFGERRFPRGLEKLIHLRYLSLRMCILSELPPSISNLKYLQILDLCTSSEVNCVIPNVIWKMKKLTHLHLPLPLRTNKGQILQLGSLSGLETLKNFDTCLCNVNDLAKLTNLRNLSANIEGNIEDVAKIVEYLNINSHRLHKSCIDITDINFCSDEDLALLHQVFRCCNLEELTLKGYIQKLPRYNANSYSISLTTISLWRSRLTEDPFPMFEKIPNLQVLLLGNDSFMGKQMECSAMGFRQLRNLYIRYLPNLENWKVDEGALPNLSYLVLRGCISLVMLPDGMRFISTLRLLRIGEMPDAFNKRVQVVDGEEGDDLNKVRQATIDFF